MMSGKIVWLLKSYILVSAYFAVHSRAGASSFRLVRLLLRYEQARGVWGHGPPGKFIKLGTLRSLLGPCLGQNATRITHL